MRLKFNNMNELQRLIQKNGAVVKADEPVRKAPVVDIKPTPVVEKVEPKTEPKKPENNIALEGISLLRKQNESLMEAVKSLTGRINQQDKLIAELTKEEKVEDSKEPNVEGKQGNFKFKIIRNNDGLIDRIEVNRGEEDVVSDVKSKTFDAVKEVLRRS